MSTLVWIKSSYSGGEGGECVEVAYDWRKSSYSGGEGGQCLEVAAHPHVVHVRDSKETGGPVLDFPQGKWSEFVRYVTR